MENFANLIHGHEPVLIDFLSHKKYTADCTPVLSHVKNVLGERIRIITVDVAGSKELITSHGLHIDEESYSTLILFRNGRILWREKGLPTGIEIIRNIAYSLK